MKTNSKNNIGAENNDLHPQNRNETPNSKDLVPDDERERIHVDLENLSTSRKRSSEIDKVDVPDKATVDTKSNLTQEDYESLSPQSKEDKNPFTEESIKK